MLCAGECSRINAVGLEELAEISDLGRLERARGLAMVQELAELGLGADLAVFR